MKLVTIGTYQSAPIAHIAVNVLHAHGIKGFVVNDNIVAWDWCLSDAIGGVLIQVEENDVAVAREILKTASTIEPEDLEKAALAAPLEPQPDTRWSWFYPDDAIDSAHEKQANIEVNDVKGAGEVSGEDTKQIIPNAREKAVATAFRGAFLFLIFPPLQALVTYYLVLAYIQDMPMRAMYRTQLKVATLVNLPFVVLSIVIARNVVQYFMIR